MTNKNLKFTKQQTEVLKCVVDYIIPAKDPMPSASDANAVIFISSAVSISDQSRKSILECLNKIDAMAQEKGFSYPRLNQENQKEILLDIEANHNQCFRLIVRETYNSYYTNPMVLKLIGLPGRAPQPLGYELNQASLDILEPVKERGEIWRPA
tara:strand:+ start:1424 stop:1885 length:462 start_codon:yes stop_codon:yes gene_type:complete